MQITNKLNGDKATLDGRAFWLNSALKSNVGVAVARCHATSTTLRLPSDEQLRADAQLNCYWADAGNTGRLQNYLLDMTEEDLQEHGIVPGVFDGLRVNDGPRPKTNRADKILSAKRHQQSQDWLQNDCIGQPADY
jgi:hypothetical protein